MKRVVARALVLLVPAVACGSPREPSARPPSTRAPHSATPIVPATSADAGAETRTVSSDGVMAAMLVAHLEDTKRRVSQTTVGEERIWTDGAILERATDLPAPITSHLARTGRGPVAREQMVDLLDQVEKARPRGHVATLVRDDGREFACRFEAGSMSARTNCVYANYVEARYPGASFVVTGPFEPVLVVVGSTIRAVIMPVK